MPVFGGFTYFDVFPEFPGTQMLRHKTPRFREIHVNIVSK
jgi:hypothetical protein